MGQRCTTVEAKDVPDRRSYLREESMSMSSYSGPFKVPGLNSGTFESEYDTGIKGNMKVQLVRNKVTRQQCFAYKLSKIECPCQNPEEILSTIQKLQRLEHPNICRLYEAFDDKAFIVLIYQEVVGNTLVNAVKSKKHMSERGAAEIGWQLIRTIAAASHESHALVHGALWPKNVMVVDDGRIVITDYGLVGVLKQDAAHKLNKESLSFCAPEIVEPWYRVQNKAAKKRKPKSLPTHERTAFTNASDVWSVGVILFQLLSGKTPFHGKTLLDLGQQIVEADVDLARLGNVSSAASFFISSLLTKDPSKRPRAEELLKNKWLTDYNALADTEVDPEVLKNLASVHAESRFKKLMMQMIAERTAPSKVRALEDAFTKLDVSGDGLIGLAEMKEYLKTHPDFAKVVDVTQLDKVFEEIDSDGGGVISLQEFVVATLDTQHDVLERELWNAFRAIDTNHDGKLSKKELRKVVKEMGGGGRLHPETLVEITNLVEFEVADEITFEQFTALVHEEGGRNKRYAIGVCSRVEKSCATAVRVGVSEPVRACFATM